jgi:hypothetical protein
MVLSFFPFFAAAAYHNFTQILNHFDTQLPDTFLQRYFIDDSTVTNSSTNLLLFLGGLGALDTLDSLMLSSFARETSSVLVGLEHRFFGKSVPPSSPLNFLSVDQVLSDIDWFLSVNDWTKYVNETHPRVAVIGSGYSASLATWFKLRFPHQVVGAWASSAPLKFVTSYPMLDEEVASGLRLHSPMCLNTTSGLLQRVHQLVETRNTSEVRRLKELFHFRADQDDVSFLYVIAQAISSLFTERGSISNAAFCNVISLQGTFEALSLAVDTILTRIGETPQSFDPLLNFSDANHRSKWWLSCSELGWFPTASPDGIRSPWVNISYFDRVCRAKFGISAIRFPDHSDRFGGANPSVSGVFFTIGASDPYRFLSVPQGINRSSLELYRSVIPPPAGISADLYSSAGEAGSSVRTECLAVVRSWIENACAAKCKRLIEGHCVFQQCVCNDGWSGTDCEIRMHSLTAFRILTILCIAVPTVFLVALSLAVWFCGASDDDVKGQQRK